MSENSKILTFHTLTLQVTKRIDEKNLKSYDRFIDDFKDFKKDARNNNRSEFKGVNSNMFAVKNDLYIIFISNSPDFLKKIQSEMEILVNKAIEKAKVDLLHSFKTGSIV